MFGFLCTLLLTLIVALKENRKILKEIFEEFKHCLGGIFLKNNLKLFIGV